MSYEDEWDYTSPRDQLDQESANETDLAALRREVAELRQMLTETPDPAAEVAIADNRRAAQERADREVKAAEAAGDPATLATLRGLETEAEVLDFLRQNGMNG